MVVETEATQQRGKVIALAEMEKQQDPSNTRLITTTSRRSSRLKSKKEEH